MNDVFTTSNLLKPEIRIFKVKAAKLGRANIDSLWREHIIKNTSTSVSLSPCNHSMVNQKASGYIKKEEETDLMALFLFPLVLISNDCEINRIIPINLE